MTPTGQDLTARLPHGRIVAGVVFLGLAALALNPYVSTVIDDAHFMLLARSLARGRGYRDIAYVGAPPHTYLPFGLPVLLTPTAWLFSQSVLAHKLVVVLCGLGLVLASASLADRRERGLGRQVMLLTAASPLALSFSTNAMVDMPYALAAVLAIAAYREPARGRTRGLVAEGAAIALLLAAYFLFVGALALFAAVVIHLALRRRWKLCAATVLVFVAAVWLWEGRCYRQTQIQPTIYKDHVSKFAGLSSPGDGHRSKTKTTGLVTKIARRGKVAAGSKGTGLAGCLLPPAFVSRLGEDCFPHFGFGALWGGPPRGPMPKWQVILASLCALLVFVGWCVKLRACWGLRELYFGGFVALQVLGAPRDPGPMARVLPFLFYYALVAGDWLGHWAHRRRAGTRRGLFVALLMANLLVSVSLAAVNARGLWTVDPSTDRGLARIYPNDWAVRIAAARRVAASARACARVMCRRGYAEVLHVLTGLPMVALPEDVEPPALLALAEGRADYLIAMRGRRRMEHLLWLVQSGRSRTFRLAFSLKSGEVEVFVLERQVEGALSGPGE